MSASASGVGHGVQLVSQVRAPRRGRVLACGSWSWRLARGSLGPRRSVSCPSGISTGRVPHARGRCARCAVARVCECSGAAVRQQGAPAMGSRRQGDAGWQPAEHNLPAGYDRRYRFRPPIYLTLSCRPPHPRISKTARARAAVSRRHQHAARKWHERGLEYIQLRHGLNRMKG